ncbi:MAG: hypothetical protein OXC26_07055 [Albidovulum sp.]|nr:hypothetical protein [Albidovulum sp.]
MNLDKLNRSVLAAHASGDGVALAQLYQFAGNEFVSAGSIDEGCFFLTQAYVYSLEFGLESAEEIRIALIEHGRER